MSTTFTLPTVKAQLVTKYTTALATASTTGGQVPVHYSWNPNVTDECVFLGRKPAEDDLLAHSIANQVALATIKAGRKQRQETYQIEATLKSYRGDLGASDAATCESRAFTLLALLESVHADDPKIGLAVGVVQKTEIVAVDAFLHAFERGWRSEIVFTVEVTGRLT